MSDIQSTPMTQSRRNIHLFLANFFNVIAVTQLVSSLDEVESKINELQKEQVKHMPMFTFDSFAGPTGLPEPTEEYLRISQEMTRLGLAACTLMDDLSAAANFQKENFGVDA